MSSETMETNFLSNMALFQKYGSNLVGFTGTLGSAFGQSMLQEVYSVETIVIPELYYKRFHELPAKIFNSKPKWLRAVAQSALHESFRKRAVLVICQTIGEAENVAEQIKAQQHVKEVKNKAELKIYTRNDRNQEHRVEKVIPGDIIVATNLAGRGTDINTVSVDQYGGLHVILTFLPDSLRVEQQAFGRTARQGAKGTGEIIVLTDTKHVDCNRLKASRDELEVAKLKRFKEKELPIILAKDKLFSKFCNMYTSIRHQLHSKATEKLGFNGLSVIEQTILNAIEQLWAFFLKRIDDNEIKLSESDITNEYKVFEKHLMEACLNEDKIISTTENCFYWIQIGNEYYRRGNRKKEDNTKALKSFEKAIQIDEPFTPGAHAGLGFCLLRLHSHKDGDYCRVISLLTYALKSLHEEIGLYCAAQTLIKHRNGRIDSELFKQLTEKINLLGDFCNNIQDTISVVKKSLRSVYVTHILSSLLSFKFKLDDNKPTIPSKRNYGRFELEFHDLTCREDMGRKDQAVDTLRNTKQIEIQVQDQNLIRLMECVGKTIKTFLLQLDGISSISEVKWILQEVKPTAFSIRINKFSSKQMYSLKDSKLHKRRKVVLIIEIDGATTREQIHPEIDGEFPLISDDDETVEIYFEGEIEVNQSSIIDKTKAQAQNVSDLEILESFLEPRQDMSLIMTGVTPKAVARNWTKSQKSEGCEENQIKQSQILRLVQYFSKTNSLFTNLSTKDAEIIVSSFRDWNIPIILRLLSMDYNEATFALANSSREREDVKEKALKEIGFQFSTSYIPLEIIRDLKQRGLELFPEVRENSFIPWRSVATLSIVASVQVAVGGFLISSGFGTPFGMRMITEGMSDFLAAHRAYDSRNFSLKDYSIQKGISSVISYGTIGKAALKDAIFGGKSLVTGASVEVAEEAGKRVIANQSLNHTLQTARLNLQSLTLKYAATQGCEHITRAGLNAVMNSLLEFSFESVKSNISDAVTTGVRNQFVNPDNFDALRYCFIMDNMGQLEGRVESWMYEVTSSSTVSQYWDSVGLPLCQGIMSDVKYLKSAISIGARAIAVINGCHEIANAVGKVCEHIFKNLLLEKKIQTPAYIIQREFKLIEKDAVEIVNGMKFGLESPFKIEKYPDESFLSKFNIEENKIKDFFNDKHGRFLSFSKSDAAVSRIISKVVGHLTNHIIGVANRQLAQPMSTFAVGKLVNTISSEIQRNFLVREDEMSVDQRRVLELKRKDPTTLSDDDRKFLANHDRPVVFADQIIGNAKDYTLAYASRSSVAHILNMKDEEISNMKVAKTFTKEQINAITKIRNGEPADMTVAFLLAKINNQNIKLVEDPNYKPTNEDKEKGTKILLWEAGERKGGVGHYKLIDAVTGQVRDFAGLEENDCLYRVFSEITGKSTNELREQAVHFIACNEELFSRVNESAQWIRDRHPENAAEVLHLGGLARNQRRATDSTVVTVNRMGVDGVPMIHEVTIKLEDGEGFTPETGERTEQVDDINRAIRESRNGQFILLINGQQEWLEFKRVVAGHTVNAKLGARGASFNTVVLTAEANTKMSNHFEDRVKKFKTYVKQENSSKQILISNANGICNIAFRAGETGELVIGPNNTVPFSKSISCFAYIDLNNYKPEARQAVLKEWNRIFTEPKGTEHISMNPIVYRDSRNINHENAYAISIKNSTDPQILPQTAIVEHRDLENIDSNPQGEG